MTRRFSFEKYVFSIDIEDKYGSIQFLFRNINMASKETHKNQTGAWISVGNYYKQDSISHFHFRIVCWCIRVIVSLFGTSANYSVYICVWRYKTLTEDKSCFSFLFFRHFHSIRVLWCYFFMDIIMNIITPMMKENSNWEYSFLVNIP